MKKLLNTPYWDKGKFRRILMRLTMVKLVLMFSLLNTYASVYSQTKISDLSLNKTELSEALKSIEKLSDYTFIFNYNDVQGHTVTAHLKDMTIEECMNNILKDKPFSYKVDGDIVIVSFKNLPLQQIKQKTIKGIVTDMIGNPLPGVTVVIKGTKIGVATDAKGEFILVGKKNDVLIVSFIGMQAKEVKYLGKELKITLKEKTQSIDEVVVSTGYGQIKKRNLTSAVTSLKADEIKVPGVSTIDNMLEGKIPVMIFMQNSGQVGAAPKIIIRGQSTILGNQQPLWVLDGIPLSDPVQIDPQRMNDPDFVNLLGNAISGINPDDIDKIDVLKDASATALYGTKAANGVIVITTKKGKAGKPSINYSTNLTFVQRPSYSDRAINLMNSKDRVDLSREIFFKRIAYEDGANFSTGYEGSLYKYYKGEISYNQFKEDVDKYETMNTDWFGILTQNEFSQSHTVSLSGGSNNFRYYTSLGYTDQGGVIKGENNNRYTANMKLTGNYDKISFTFGLSGNIQKRKYNPKDLSILDYSYKTSRAIPAFNEDGSLAYYNKSIGSNSSFDYNILNEINNTYDKKSNNGLNLQMNFTYRFNDNLRLSQTFAYNQSDFLEEIYYGEKSHYISNLRGCNYGEDINKESSLNPIGGELQRSSTKNYNYVIRTQINYNKYLDDVKNNSISTSIGCEINSVKYDSFKKTHRCYLPNRGKIFNPIDLKKYPAYSNWIGTDMAALGQIRDNIENKISTYLTLSYSFKDLYIFNINGRVDASNKFGDQTNNKFLPIWSVSGKWNIKEDIFENVKWINFMDLRTSFGFQGNMISSASPELIIKRGGYSDIYNSYVSKIEKFPNPDLKWEKTMSYNAELDFALFQNKINCSVTYFYKDTKDAFLSQTVSNINGVNTYVTNTGRVRNQGFEFSFNFNPINKSFEGGKKFYWRIDPQIGQVINKLISQATKNNQDPNNNQKVKYGYEDYLDGNVFIKGKPLNTFYSYKFAGLDHETGKPLFYSVGEENSDRYKNLKYEDLIKEVTECSGTRIPKIQGSISNTFGYNNLVLSFNINYSLGNKIRLFKLYNDNAFISNAPSPINNVSSEFNKRWRKPGDEKYTNIPSIIDPKYKSECMYPWWTLHDVDGALNFAGNLWEMYDNSNTRVVSGDFLRLSNLSLSYILPKNICKQINIKSGTLGFSATNLFTICSNKLKGQDPAQSGSSSGINLSVRPTYSLSFNFNF